MTPLRWFFLALICYASMGDGLQLKAQEKQLLPSRSIHPFIGPKKTIKVEDYITDVAPARVGQFLILSIADAKKIVIFDCATQNIVKELSLSTGDFKVAGCLDHFVVADNERGTIERYSLDTFELEKSIKSPFGGKAFALSCGASAAGPVLLRYSVRLPDIEIAEYVFLDIFKLESLGLILEESSGPPVRSYFSDASATCVRPAADGTLFSMWRSEGGAQSCFLLRINGHKYSRSYLHNFNTSAVPSADGRYLYSQNLGVLTTDCAPAFGQRSSYRPCVPTSNPQFYLSLATPKREAAELPAIHQTGDEEPLLSLPTIDYETTAIDAAPRGKYPWLDRRVFYYLPANLLITIPYSDESLVMQSFDFRAELDKAKKAYLYVSSVPVQNPKFIVETDFTSPLEKRKVRKYLDQPYEYQIEVASNIPSVTDKLLSGPKEMQVSNAGLVTWKQTSMEQWSGVPVSIEISNSTGRKAIHSFSIFRKYEDPYSRE